MDMIKPRGFSNSHHPEKVSNKGGHSNSTLNLIPCGSQETNSKPRCSILFHIAQIRRQNLGWELLSTKGAQDYAHHTWPHTPQITLRFKRFAYIRAKKSGLLQWNLFDPISYGFFRVDLGRRCRSTITWSSSALRKEIIQQRTPCALCITSCRL